VEVGFNLFEESADPNQRTMTYALLVKRISQLAVQNTLRTHRKPRSTSFLRRPILDEIGEMPLAMRAKLLRVLEEQELERVGDTRTRKVDVRLVAASNRDLKKEVDEGRFRQDLFYRLSVFPIEVPPLRQRREDIAPLVAHFIRQSARRMNRSEPQISKQTLDQLATHQ
jgi:transcriptional regulator of acetoin/glycerol metabolism